MSLSSRRIAATIRCWAICRKETAIRLKTNLKAGLITVRKAEDRGQFDHGWLDTSHTFSFSDYHDPSHMDDRNLRCWCTWCHLHHDQGAPAFASAATKRSGRVQTAATARCTGAFANAAAADHDGRLPFRVDA